MSLLTEAAVDLAGLISTDDFATSATYTPSGGAATTIKVLFDENYESLNPLSVEVADSAPFVLCKTVDVSGATNAARIVVSGTTYKPVSVQPKGDLTVLVLSEV